MIYYAKCFLSRAKGIFTYRRKYWLNYKGKKETSINIVLNGPSAKRTFFNKEKSGECFMANFAACGKEFFIYKPEMYCIADPSFVGLGKAVVTEDMEFELKQFWNNLNKIEWNMRLFVPQFIYDKVINKINNDNIEVISFYATRFRTSENTKLLNWFWKKNIASPVCSNVAHAMIYISIQMGYGRISIHGLDFDRLRNYSVNSNNDVLFYSEHYYEDKGVLINATESKWVPRHKFYELIQSFANALIQFSLLKDYADYIGISVINMNVESMVDCFDKIIEE